MGGGKQLSEAAGLLAADGLPRTCNVWKTGELPIFAVWFSTFLALCGVDCSPCQKSHSGDAVTPSGS